MAGKYDKARAKARVLIETFGVPLTLKHKSYGSPSNPWEAPTGTSKDYQCYGVILNYESREIDGIVVKRDDRKVLLASEGLAVEPSTNDFLTIGSVDFAIESVVPLAPSNEAILYTLQVRTV